MKRERTSYAFLMEMMWVCAFFIICSCIFVMAFVKAEQMSRNAGTLSEAVQAASNAMETSFSLGEAADGSVCSTEAFTITIDAVEADGLLSVTVTAVNAGDGSVLYSLEGARSLLEPQNAASQGISQ